MLALLATAHLAAGDVADAKRTVAQALAVGERSGERFYLAEVHRLQGELRLADSDSIDAFRLAEADFRTAMRVAGEQGAAQLVLRAATSLVRLRRRRHPQPAWTPLLVDARGRIAEGVQLPDIVEADALIAGER
jgi:predicted ATPase